MQYTQQQLFAKLDDAIITAEPNMQAIRNDIAAAKQLEPHGPTCAYDTDTGNVVCKCALVPVEVLDGGWWTHYTYVETRTEARYLVDDLQEFYADVQIGGTDA